MCNHPHKSLLLSMNPQQGAEGQYGTILDKKRSGEHSVSCFQTFHYSQNSVPPKFMTLYILQTPQYLITPALYQYQRGLELRQETTDTLH